MDDSAVPPLLGIIGQDLAGNPTQFAMEKAILAAGLDWRFISFEISEHRLSDALLGIDSLGLRGAAIAPSLAGLVSSALEELSPISRESRWVDVIVRKNGNGLVGHNLLAEAFASWLAIESNANATAALVGFTDKGLAMLRGLRNLGLNRVLVSDPSLEGPSGFEQFCSLDFETLASTQLIVRGLAKPNGREPALISNTLLDMLSTQCTVVDLACCSGSSPLLRSAMARGCRTLSTIDLMVMRASAMFRMWTGETADESLLREAFEEYLEI